MRLPSRPLTGHWSGTTVSLVALRTVQVTGGVQRRVSRITASSKGSVLSKSLQSARERHANTHRSGLSSTMVMISARRRSWISGWDAMLCSAPASRTLVVVLPAKSYKLAFDFFRLFQLLTMVAIWSRTSSAVMRWSGRSAVSEVIMRAMRSSSPSLSVSLRFATTCWLSVPSRRS